MANDDTNITQNMDNNDGPVMMGKIKVPYGKDNSLYAGAAKDEQISDRRFGGGIGNLSHTIDGASANQSQD